MNQTSDSLQVECTENFDGGLPQSFFMEILELPTLRPKYNSTSTKTPPIFYADGLEPGASYRILLYAVNAKGKGDFTIIDTVTFKGVAKFTGKFKEFILIIFIVLINKRFVFLRKYGHLLAYKHMCNVIRAVPSGSARRVRHPDDSSIRTSKDH